MSDDARSFPRPAAAASSATAVDFVATAAGTAFVASASSSEPGGQRSADAAAAETEVSNQTFAAAAVEIEVINAAVNPSDAVNTTMSNESSSLEREAKRGRRDAVPTSVLLDLIEDKLWTEAFRRFDACPNDAKYRTNFYNDSPLRAAVIFGAPMALFQQILAADPSALTEREQIDGGNVLHLGCSFNLDVDLLDAEKLTVLLSAEGAEVAAVEVAVVEMERTGTPLHCACDAWMRAVERTSDDSAIARAEINIEMVLEMHPKAALVSAVVDMPGWSSVEGTPARLIRLGFESGKTVEATPAWLLWEYCSQSKAQFLDSAWNTKMRRFFTRFVDAAERASNVESEAAAERSERTAEEKERLLFHRAIEFSVVLGLPGDCLSLQIGLVVGSSEGFASRLLERDEMGRVPLHLVSKLGSERQLALEALVDACPSAAGVPDKAGSLPLCSYLRSGHASVDGAVKIAEAYPAALTTQDPQTGLYPWMLAAAAAETVEGETAPNEAEQERRALISVEISYELLKMAPEVVACLDTARGA